MKKLLLTSLLLAAATTIMAQKTTGQKLKWWNPATSTNVVVDGQLWPKEVKNFYDRFPARAEKQVRPEVWALSRNAAGLKLRFRTTSKTIEVRYTTVARTYSMDHFPNTGRSGVDLFAVNNDGTWAWANPRYTFTDTVTYKYAGLDLDQGNYKNGREYCLYLPIYNGLKWLEIGVNENETFTPLPPSTIKPIIAYGTSITQGGVASRPGNAWLAMAERDLNIPIVNLGFSGNGRMEKEIIDMINEKEASVYVFDCLGNMASNTDSAKLDVTSRIVSAVTAIRGKHPATPILLIEYAGFIKNRMNTAKGLTINALNEANAKAYKELTAKGIKNLYVLSADKINLGADGTVDGTHPSDLGMYRYAKAFDTIIAEILKTNKPKR